MLKFPCPAEQELDKIRDKMWEEADRDPDKYFKLIKQKAKQALQEHGYHIEPTGFNIGRIIRDKGKVKYGEKTK